MINDSWLIVITMFQTTNQIISQWLRTWLVQPTERLGPTSRSHVLRQHQRFEGAEVRQDHMRPGPPDVTPEGWELQVWHFFQIDR